MPDERVWRDAGFLPLEVKELAPQMPIDAPYVEAMIKERASAYEEAQRAGVSKAEWREIIEGMYADHNWISKGKVDPWKMLRKNEDEWRRKHPEDEYWEQWRAKRRKYKKKTKAGYDEKYEAGQTKYPRGAAYR